MAKLHFLASTPCRDYEHLYSNRNRTKELFEIPRLSVVRLYRPNHVMCTF